MLNPARVVQEFYSIIEIAGVRRCRLHDLRHWHASSLTRAGLDPQSVADRLGHHRATVTMSRYAHAFEEQRAAAALTMAELSGETAIQLARRTFSDPVCTPFTDDFEVAKTYKWRHVPLN